MKKLNIYYWICTGLLFPAIGIGSVFDILATPESVQVFISLGYPPYVGPFLGIAHLLGLIAIVIPKFPLVKEWAYAGFTFDILGAIYSNLAMGNSLLNLVFPSIVLLFLFGSYFLYHTRVKMMA